jgi:murein DD-endopeptidase MepM/ murein hydrolase activator NlpD
MPFLRFILLILLFFSGLTGKAQLKYYAEPLKIPLSLSGNFGELRPDHFHMGLDFRTEQKTGIPVFSSAEGFVSRITVSPSGFGRALYINHPNSTTTVYGHLEKFRKDIEEYVKSEQYRLQSFSVDLKIPSGKFKVQHQEQIARSGNSGSSGGPHLHFEIRDTPSQDALNPLCLAGFKIKDSTPPKIKSVQISPLNTDSHVEFGVRPKTYTTAVNGSEYTLSPNNMITAFGAIGIAVQADDYFDDNPGQCGIYSARLTINGKVVFTYSMDKISFSQNRYVNSLLNYGIYINNGTRFAKMWCDPGNHLNIYHSVEKKGILTIDSGKIYAGELTLSDVSGNSSKFEFRVKGIPGKVKVQKPENAIVFSFNKENRMVDPGFDISTPKGAFYDDFNFRHKESDRLPGYYSGIHHIHFPEVPVHKPISIKIKTKDLPDSLASKAFIAKIEDGKSPGYAGGHFADGWIETTILEFGKYGVMVDTVAPEILPLTIKNNALTEPWEVSFKISDKQTGIKNYSGYIDGKWVLFEYDPRISTLTYKIDTTRLTIGKRHSLVLTVTDKVKNASTFKASFWK